MSGPQEDPFKDEDDLDDLEQQEEDGEAQSAGDEAEALLTADLLREDPRRAENPRDLAERLNVRLDELEWRIAARDKQSRCLELELDLVKPATVHFAEQQAKARSKSKPLKAPEGARAAKRLLGRLLAQCEGGMGEVLNERAHADHKRPGHQFGLATGLANAAANLARAMDQIGDANPPAARIKRKTKPQGAGR
jgi:hypothetical protein